jgi:hypothetical protein
MLKTLRIFRLSNNCWWMIAHNLSEAKNISIKQGFAKKIENITLLGDQTDFYFNDQKMTEATKTMLEEGKK